MEALTARCNHGKLIQEYCAECEKTVKEVARESQQEPLPRNKQCCPECHHPLHNQGDCARCNCEYQPESASSSPSPSAPPHSSVIFTDLRVVCTVCERAFCWLYDEQKDEIRILEKCANCKASVPQTEPSDRALFEEWANREDVNLGLARDMRNREEYQFDVTQLCWQAFQAGREQMAAEVQEVATGIHDDELLARLDPEIREIVATLRQFRVETFESCSGGEGHAFLEPTVRFHGRIEEGQRALSVALAQGLKVRELRRVWPVIDNEPTGPYWELTFVVAEVREQRSEEK